MDHIVCYVEFYDSAVYYDLFTNCQLYHFQNWFYILNFRFIIKEFATFFLPSSHLLISFQWVEHMWF